MSQPERPSDPHAAQGRDHVETILQALDHLLDAECYGPASLLTWAEEGIAALDALIAERDEAENLAAIHDGRAQSLATEVERLEALELEAALPQHASDCATNNEPALPRGDCDCRPDLGDPAAVIAYYTHLVAGLLAERQQDSATINRGRELALVYDELNRALGSNAPKAWDRIKERLASEQPADLWYGLHSLIGDDSGHPDEPNTWFARMVELQGSIDFALSELIRLAQMVGEEKWPWVVAARVFDGVDGEAIIAAIADAKDEIDLVGLALLEATRV